MAAIQTAFTGSAGGGVFADGSDGPAVFDGVSTVAGLVPSASTYTLTRDLYLTTMTVNPGVTVQHANNRIFCEGAAVNNGTIQDPPNNASGTAGGSGPASGSLQGGQAGPNGGTGAGASGGQSVASAGVGTGGAGGGSGASGGNNAGGAAKAANFTAEPWRLPASALSGMMLASKSANVQTPGGGCGGASGGGDGTNSGGGGGSGGNNVVIFAASFTNNGTINAQGGAGGTPGTGNCGGGGGGGGGDVIIYTLAPWVNNGTVNVAGGAASSGIGTGAAGAAGTSGTILNVVI